MRESDLGLTSQIPGVKAPGVVAGLERMFPGGCFHYGSATNKAKLEKVGFSNKVLPNLESKELFASLQGAREAGITEETMVYLIQGDKFTVKGKRGVRVHSHSS